MVASPKSLYISPEEYLQMEEKSDIKHEYIDGQVYAMAGASDPHVTVTLNLASLLRNHVRTGRCRVYILDMKARIQSLDRFYYPDVMVTCDDRDRQTSNYKQYPRLIVEILSDSTEAFDSPAETLRERGDKFADYQQIESLEEYVLINTKRQRVECFRRSDNGLWILQSYTSPPENSYQLQSIQFEGTMAELYEDVSFEVQ